MAGRAPGVARVGTALRCSIFLVAAVTRRREAAVVAFLVTIGAWQRSVKPGEIAANFHVIETRRRKRPLCVAGAAARR